MASKEFQAFANGPLFVPKHDFKNHRDEAIAQYRKDLMMNSLPGGVLPEGVTVEECEIAGVPCASIQMPNATDGWILIQIHGGGFCAGPPCTKQWPFIKIGMDCRINIMSIDYRLAPEHPYPAALEDCVAVYKELLAQGQDPQKVIFEGESAGASLCLTTTLYAKDHGLPAPKALVLSSPCTNVGLSAEERRVFAPNDPLLDETDELMRFYVGEADPKDPYLSSAFADFKGMPPIFLQCGTNEMLGPDAVAILKNCIDADVDINVHAYAEMGHVFFLQAGMYPEADVGLAEMTGYIQSVMK